MLVRISRHLISAIVLIFGLNSSIEGKLYKLPTFINPCNKSDPNLNACIHTAIELIRPKLSNGIPEIYIPPLDPLHLPKAVLTDNALEATFDDIKIRHLNENEILGVNFDLEKPELTLHLHIPKLSIESQYKVRGKLLILELDGKGASSGNYSDVNSKIVMNGNIIVKNNKEYFNFDRAKVKLSIKDAQIYSEGLIHDPEINDAMNKVINSNIVAFLEELMPVIEATVENFVLQMTKKFFATFPVDTLFI